MATYLLLQRDHHPLLHIAPPHTHNLTEEHLEEVSNRLFEEMAMEVLEAIDSSYFVLRAFR